MEIFVLSILSTAPSVLSPSIKQPLLSFTLNTIIARGSGNYFLAHSLRGIYCLEVPRKYLEVLTCSPARGPPRQPWDILVNKCTDRPGANIIIKISFNVIAHPQNLIIRAEFLRYFPSTRFSILFLPYDYYNNNKTVQVQFVYGSPKFVVSYKYGI